MAGANDEPNLLDDQPLLDITRRSPMTLIGDQDGDENESGSEGSNVADDVRRMVQEHFAALSKGQGGCDGGNKVGESKDPEQNEFFTGRNQNVKRVSDNAEGSDTRRKRLDEIQRDIKAGMLSRCINQDKTGDREEDDIIEEEINYEGSSSKTSSLVASLTVIVEKQKQGRGEKSETIEKIKVCLKRYRNIKVNELVTRSDFEHILAMASRYEELTSASVSYISRLSKYKSVMVEETKATKRVELANQRAMLLNEVANEKQTRVDAELELVKTYAQQGDALYVKILALKKEILKLEAEKKEVDMSFQKIVANLSIVIEEAAQAYEEHHVAVRKWREEKTSLEFSCEAIEKAETVWASFLSTL